ncbi:isochorismatase family protein [Aeromonas veronii]
MGPTMPELTSALPDVKVINRTVINAWDDPAVRAAIEKTGRKQLIIAGVSLEICASFPALSAKAAGYDARVVLDASGTFNEAKRTTGLQRLLGAGIPVTDYASAAVEMLRSNVDPKAHDVYNALDMPFATLVWQMQEGSKKS